MKTGHVLIITYLIHNMTMVQTPPHAFAEKPLFAPVSLSKQCKKQQQFSILESSAVTEQQQFSTLDSDAVTEQWGISTKASAGQRLLSRMTVEEDVEAFLEMFDWTRACEGWPQWDWADALTPLLSGKVKAEIHTHCGQSPVDTTGKFHRWRHDPAVNPRAQTTYSGSAEDGSRWIDSQRKMSLNVSSWIGSSGLFPLRNRRPSDSMAPPTPGISWR